MGTCSRSSQVPFGQALEDLEASLEAHTKAIRCYAPKGPVIGVPAGTVLLGESAMEDCSGSMGLAEEEGETEDEDEATRQMDDSSVDEADLVGALDESDSQGTDSSGSSLGGGHVSDFV